ncbi:hypothetical protein B0H14DRAFT_2579353 [Mycena olivaceomarginata]|nr:hypothetical protein B0H14DRAFT_2579353 [Mycena olivaceomarginata]
MSTSPQYFENTLKLPDGVEIRYTDCGALNTSDYTTMIVIHRTGFNGYALAQLHACAQKYNLRIVLCNRLHYHGSTKYSEEELAELMAGSKYFQEKLGQWIQHHRPLCYPTGVRAKFVTSLLRLNSGIQRIFNYSDELGVEKPEGYARPSAQQQCRDNRFKGSRGRLPGRRSGYKFRQLYLGLRPQHDPYAPPTPFPGPLHCATQRNTKITARRNDPGKENLDVALVTVRVFCAYIRYAARNGVASMHQNDESLVSRMLAQVTGDPANSLRWRDGDGGGRREWANMTRDVQNRMIQMNRELTNFH